MKKERWIPLQKQQLRKDADLDPRIVRGADHESMFNLKDLVKLVYQQM